MFGRTVATLLILAVCLCVVPTNTYAQDAEGPMATMVMADGLEYSPIEVPGFDSGMQIAGLHGDFTAEGLYTLRLWFPDGYQFPSHYHPMDENLTVLEGTLVLAMSDVTGEGEPMSYSVGDFVNIPAEHAHWGGAKGETVIQLHGEGPFAILLSE